MKKPKFQIPALEITDIDSPIRLIQTGIDKFTVQYGLQVEENLNYEEAAKRLGGAIMHALACVGRLNNAE